MPISTRGKYKTQTVELVISTLSQVNRCLLYDKSEHRFFSSNSVERNQNQSDKNLSTQVQELLENSKMSPEELSQVFVLLGPGSFTSLRIGVNFAQGLAQSLKIPLFGLPTSSLFPNDFFISLRPALTADLSIEECLKKEIEFLKVSTNSEHTIEVPSKDSLILGTRENFDWPEEEAILRAIQNKANWTKKVEIEYGLTPKISGKRES